MYTYCIFLRGINVNGIKIKMAELKAVLATFGYNDPQTILATGNIILSFDQPLADLSKFKEDLETKLSQHYGYEAFLFIRDFTSIKALVTNADLLESSTDCHTYALILNHPDTKEELQHVFNTLNHSELEALSPIDNDLFWIIEKGNTLLSEFGKKALGKKHFKTKLTSRNMNTIRKIYKQMNK